MPQRGALSCGRAEGALPPLRVRLLAEFRVYRGEHLIGEAEWKRTVVVRRCLLHPLAKHSVIRYA